MARLLLAALVLGTAPAAATAAWAAEAHPVVVELFTSQGCNSCPPADAYLGSLKGRSDVIALSFHVNYWDYLGWSDTFATEETTRRQHRYAKTLGERSIYTPQIVVGGVYHEVGSKRRKIDRAIKRVALSDDGLVRVELEPDGAGMLAVRIAEGAVAEPPAAVWLMLFDRYHEVAIENGENGGRTLGYHNIVHDIRRLGEWQGAPMALSLSLADLAAAGGDGLVVLVQENDGAGRILGAARFDLTANDLVPLRSRERPGGG